jgi:hypothetical protein
MISARFIHATGRLKLKHDRWQSNSGSVSHRADSMKRKTPYEGEDLFWPESVTLTEFDVRFQC